MSELPQGFQVKARDHDGNVHDERWTASREVAEEVVGDLQGDPLVAEAWIEGEA
jgi:hypothetical protein